MKVTMKTYSIPSIGDSEGDSLVRLYIAQRRGAASTPSSSWFVIRWAPSRGPEEKQQHLSGLLMAHSSPGLPDFRSSPQEDKCVSQFKYETHFSTFLYVKTSRKPIYPTPVMCSVMMLQANDWVKGAAQMQIQTLILVSFRRPACVCVCMFDLFTDLSSVLLPRIQVSCLLQVCGVQ